MKIADAITYCIHYHKINSRPNTHANYEFILGKLGHRYQNRHIDAIQDRGNNSFSCKYYRRQKTKYQKE